METEEIENDEWYSIKMELEGHNPVYISAFGHYHDAPDRETMHCTIADAKQMFEEIKYALPKDAEYSIVKVEEIFRVSYALNVELEKR